MAVMAVASAWDLADHALAPIVVHPAYPYVFAGALVLTSLLGWHLLRRALMVPNTDDLAAAVARGMADLGAKAPSAGTIESAVIRGINEAMAPLAEEFRRDIREIDKRVAYLEGHYHAARQWDERDRRNT